MTEMMVDVKKKEETKGKIEKLISDKEFQNLIKDISEGKVDEKKLAQLGFLSIVRTNEVLRENFKALIEKYQSIEKIPREVIAKLIEELFGGKANVQGNIKNGYIITSDKFKNVEITIRRDGIEISAKIPFNF
jgi:S-adenosylmethionine hydrolase